jgi:cellulose biosynthesis protein BcsQ
MENYNFNEIKNEIIACIKELNNFDKCFIVRNVYSRFAIYVVNPLYFSNIEISIKEKFGQWVDTIQSISEDEDKFIYQDLEKTSTVTENPNVFFAERHAENTNWFINESFKLKTPIISFYSFKGGVGRTTATILTAMLLAREGKKVLLIDFDLEAPGLASIFANQSNNTENLLAVKGFVDFLVDYEANQKDIAKIDLNDYYFVRNEQILVGTQGGELVIVPAIATDSKSAVSYIDKLSKANIKYGFGKDYIPDLFIQKMEEKIKPDFILIDTRTGINDVGGLVFNHYAQSIFLIFYGNQQNMFGLESILPQLKNLNKKDVRFYLVNSPVPNQETDKKEETDFFVEKSYDIFCSHFYKQDEVPAREDDTADHYPINIPFNDQALILNSYKKLSNLIENPNNPYKDIAQIILRNYPSHKEEIAYANPSILDCIIQIAEGSGSSEWEYKTQENLTKYFYPRKDYRYIFEKDKFLILGEKGVGKTALFSVLSHPEYAKALARFCGISNMEIEKTEWIIGVEKDSSDFPDKNNFNALAGFAPSNLQNYWIILLLRKLESYLLKTNPLIIEILQTDRKEIKNLASRKNIGEELHEILSSVNNSLINENKTLIIVYDYLDAIFYSENNVRGELVSALISFYYDNFVRLSNIKAKIFLRKDIFDKEVHSITDKVKISNYTMNIQWDYNQLLNIIWKRIYEQNNSFFKEIEKIRIEPTLFSESLNQVIPILGNIPNLPTKEEHEVILNKIFGKVMGGNSKTHPYNWIKNHTENTKNQIHPRTLITLFAESAKLQKYDTEQHLTDGRLIRSRNIENALKNSVSYQQVRELGEEYAEFQPIFTNLKDIVTETRSPIEEKELKKGLEALGFGDKIVDTIEKLKIIGLLRDYKPKKDSTEKRYHIPDLYLSGLGFTRLGTN